MLKRTLLLLCIFRGLNAYCQPLANSRIDALSRKDTADILYLVRYDLTQFRTKLNVLASEEQMLERRRAINYIKEDRQIFVPNAKFIDDLDPQAKENDHITYTYLTIDKYLERFISRYRDFSQNSINYINFRPPCYWRDSIIDPGTQKYICKYYTGISFLETFSGKDYTSKNFPSHNIFATFEIEYNHGWTARIHDFTFCPSTYCCRDIKNQLPVALVSTIQSNIDLNDTAWFRLCLRKGDSLSRMVNAGNWDKNGPIAWAYLKQATLHTACAAKAEKSIATIKEKMQDYSRESDFNTVTYRTLKSYGGDLENVQRYKDAYIMYDWASTLVSDGRLFLRMSSLYDRIEEIKSLELNTNADEAITGLRHLITSNGENANPDVWNALAKRYREKCDPRAQIAFEKLHAIDRENFETYKKEGDYYENCPCHNYYKAASAYGAYINAFPDIDTATLRKYQYRKKFCIAMALFTDSKYDSAKVAFSAASNICSTPEAQCYISVCAALLDKSMAQNTAALKAIKKLLDSNSKIACLNYWYGNLLYKKRNDINDYFAPSIKSIKEALSLQPDNHIWEMDLAYKYQLKADAVRIASEKIQLYSNAAIIYKSLLEKTYINKNECHYRLAQCEYKSALLYNITSSEGFKLLSDAKINMDTILGNVLYKNDTYYMKTYAFILLASKNYDSAILYFQKITQNDPEILFGLGVASFLQSHIPSSMKEIEESFKRSVSHEFVNERFRYCDINTQKTYMKLKNKYGY